ncbi:MAG TPA: hypothetical protein VEB66_04215 [Opitutaceae bacterium]|nr:hypothetical protein [Opitutaceae bacterium]
MSLALGAAGAVGYALAAGLKLLWDEYCATGRFARKLARLERQGLITVKAVPNLGRVVELTELGRNEAAGGRDPETRWSRPWDGRWWVAAFDVPEFDRRLRSRLRTSLRGAGFGHFQDSVWISPDPPEQIRQRLAGLAIDARSLSFLEAKPGIGETDADLVKGSWDFDRINQYYRDYLEVLRNRPRWYERRAWVEWLKVEWRAWTRAVRADPLLPRPLLPAGYVGCDAWAERCEVLRALLARQARLADRPSLGRSPGSGSR